MVDLDMYAQFVIFDGSVIRFVPPNPRPLYGITSALDGHTGILKPSSNASDSGAVFILVNSLKIKETVTILRYSDTFSADVSNAYYNKLPVILIVEFDLFDKSLDFWTLGIFQAKISKYEIHTPDVENAANGEKIIFEFKADDVRFSRGVDPNLSQYPFLDRQRRAREADRRQGLV